MITLAGTDTVDNSYNRIDSCIVTAGATQPLNGILAQDYHPDKHNAINGCNISNVGGNFINGAYGICVRTGYDSITVTNNSVYQTAIVLEGTNITDPIHITGNHIGDDSTPNSILIPNLGTSIGIWASDPNCEYTSGLDTIAITNNHIANITASSVVGIKYFTGTENEISQPAQGHIVSNNTLAGNTLTGFGYGNIGYGGAITGIELTSTGYAPTMHCTISGNRLNSFYASSIVGITAGGEDIGLSTVDNNMIDFGVYPNGQPFDMGLTSTAGILGISGGKGFNIIHNSIYVRVPGGALSAYGIGGACIDEGDSSGTTGVVMNNILSAYYTARDFNFSLVNFVQHVPSDYNIFDVQGPGYIGWQYHRTGTFLDSTLAGWQNRSGQDQHSQFADPLFNNTEAAAPYIDLHLQQGTPAESAGTPAYTTTTDFDGKIRARWTPVDIGADAGNFKLATVPPPDTTQKDTTTTTPPTPSNSAIVVPYPNPFSGTLTLNLLADAPGTAYVLVYSLTGKLVVSLHPNVIAGSNTITIPTDALPDGVYILHVDIDNHRQTL